MSQEDNIKNFFQSRLKENSPEEAGWNIPSDDIWESAKVHFPKEDKSRRPFLLLFSGLAGLILIGILAYSQLSNNQESISSESIVKTQNTHIEESKNLEFNQNQKAQNTTASNNKSLEVLKETELLNSKSKNELPNVSVRTNNNTNSFTRSKATQNFDTELLSQSGISATEEDLNNSEINKANSILNQEGSVDKTILTNDIADERINKSEHNGTPENNNTSSESSFSALEKTESTSNLIQVNIISTLPIDLLTYDISNYLSADHITSPLQSNKKWEIGLTTSPFVLPLERLIKEDAAEDGITNINLKYIGLNIPITRIINPKWSVTSGLYYKKGSLSVSFAEEETLDIGDNISMMFNDNSSVASITLQDQTEEITVNLKPDAQIIDGEVLSIDGNGHVNFNVLQVPLLANYHIRKNRFDYIFSLGASLDFAKIAISEFDITLSQQNRTITEPIKYTPLSVNLIDYSIQAGIGTKFHFNESINLSYGIKFDLTAVFLSTHEIGLHYRF